LEVGVARERRRPERSSVVAFKVAQVGEDEAQVFLARIALDLDFLGEAGVLGGLLDALAGRVILPAVVEAAEAVPLDPASAELRPPVRAPELQQMRAAALAAVEGKVLAHDADGLCMPARQVLGTLDRLPEPP